MNYDLSIKDERRRFVKRANALLLKQRTNVSLTDESNRTLNQNSYLHVLCRVLAMDTGVTENYAKQIYFKRIANPEIFVSVTRDPVTSEAISYVKSTADITITDMSKAIDSFLMWASENGYNLPQASLNEDGSLSWKSDDDKEAFHRAQIETSKLDERNIA